MEGFNNLSYYWEIFDYKAVSANTLDYGVPMIATLNYMHVHIPCLQNMGYRIVNETLKECQRFTLMGEFPRMGPFLQDQFRGEYVIGSDMKPKDGVKVLVYSGYSGQGTCSYRAILEWQLQPGKSDGTPYLLANNLYVTTSPNGLDYIGVGRKVMNLHLDTIPNCTDSDSD